MTTGGTMRYRQRYLRETVGRSSPRRRLAQFAIAWAYLYWLSGGAEPTP